MTLRRLVQREGTRLPGVIMLASFLGLLMTHMFTPYLNHPLGLAMLMSLDYFGTSLALSAAREG